MADQDNGASATATETTMETVEDGEITPSPEKELPFLPGFQTLQDYSKVAPTLHTYYVTVAFYTRLYFASTGPVLSGDTGDQIVQWASRRGR